MLPSSPNCSLPISAEYPTNEYPKLSDPDSDMISDLSGSLFSLTFFRAKFTFNSLTLDSNNASEPGGVTRIEVSSVVYPVPEFKILTSVILPFSTIALKDAPKPSPSTRRSGGAL